jgi:hypothetical protein
MVFLSLRKTAVFALALLGVVLEFATPGRAEAAPADLEYEVKAAFLYNFAKFVEWPPDALPDPATPVAICVLGEDPFGQGLDELVQGETLSSHRLVVRRLRDPLQIRDCQVLFVSRSEKGRLPALMAGLRGSGVLTVGEADDFLEQGGVIRFVLEQHRVRFDINLDAAERGRLKLSSKLLRLARSVNPQRRGA